MAVRFDATTDMLTYSGTGPAAGTTGYTVTLWVYIENDRNTYSTPFRYGGAGGGSVVALETDSDGTTLWAFTQSGSYSSTTNLTAGAWYGVGYTVTSGAGQGTANFYIAPAGGSTVSASGSTSSATADTHTIGGRPDSSGEWFDGRVAQVRVWSTVLSQAEVEAEWASATAVKTASLWADWPLTDASTLTDASGNGRTLSAGGTSVSTVAGPSVPSNDTAPAELASGTGTAHQSTVSVAATAGHASGTGTAHAPTGSVSASAGSASGTGAANAAMGSVAASAGSAAGTGTAHGPAGSVGASAGSASGTGTASAATGNVSAAAGSASGTGAAHQPEVTTATSEATAHAGHASGTGTAHQPTVVTALPSADAHAGHASGVGRAHNPTVRTVGLPIGSAGWQKLRAMFVEKAPPVVLVDCPNCGWPLQEARGVKYCPHGDYRSRT